MSLFLLQAFKYICFHIFNELFCTNTHFNIKIECVYIKLRLLALIMKNLVKG